MVYSYQVVKFQTISFVQGTHWSQSVGDKGILYKSLKDPFSKLIVQSSNGSKKLPVKPIAKQLPFQVSSK